MTTKSNNANDLQTLQIQGERIIANNFDIIFNEWYYMSNVKIDDD